MKLVVVTFWRAFASQFHIKMMMLTLLPFLVSAALCGFALWLGLQPLSDWIYHTFLLNHGFEFSNKVLDYFHLDSLKAVIVPFVAMWLFLPLIIVTTLIFVGILGVPFIVRHVGKRHYSALQKKRGGSFWGSLRTYIWCFFIFIILWALTLPLLLIPPVVFVVHAVLWGWLTYRMMAYDALSDYASRQEIDDILARHRWSLLLIGTVTGAISSVPTLLWFGGILSVIFFPILAACSVWLYSLIFVFTALWFQYFCLESLKRYRVRDIVVPPKGGEPSVIKEIEDETVAM